MTHAGSLAQAAVLQAIITQHPYACIIPELAAVDTDDQLWTLLVGCHQWLVSSIGVEVGPIPAGITIESNLFLGGYPHPLPTGIVVKGDVFAGGYGHPLPTGMVIHGDLYSYDHPHPLPTDLMVRGTIEA